MKKLIGLLILMPLMGGEPAGYKYWSAADLKAMSKPLSNKNDAHTSNEALGTFGQDRAMMIHRDASGIAELHETDADVIMVVSGAGTLIIGGTMPGSKSTAPGEMRAPAVEGGEKQKMAPGDILHVPPKVPHQVLVDGAQITYFVFKAKE
jgi:uncharacterized RmlC-like cupin family protein